MKEFEAFIARVMGAEVTIAADVARRTVTIDHPEPVTEREAVGLLFEHLRSKGLSVVESEDRITIRLADDAPARLDDQLVRFGEQYGNTALEQILPGTWDPDTPRLPIVGAEFVDLGNTATKLRLDRKHPFWWAHARMCFKLLEDERIWWLDEPRALDRLFYSVVEFIEDATESISWEEYNHDGCFSRLRQAWQRIDEVEYQDAIAELNESAGFTD